MKALIALLILMIGLVVMPPGPMKANPVQVDAVSFVINPDAPVAVMQVPEKGGELTMQSFNYNAMPIISIAPVAGIKDEGYTIENQANKYIVESTAINFEVISPPPLQLTGTGLIHKNLVQLGKISSVTSV